MPMTPSTRHAVDCLPWISVASTKPWDPTPMNGDENELFPENDKGKVIGKSMVHPSDPQNLFAKL